MNTNLLCGHWTYYSLIDRVARCDLEQGHIGMHKYWSSPTRGESFSWSNSIERHELRQTVSLYDPDREEPR